MFDPDDIVERSNAPLTVASTNFETRKFQWIDDSTVWIKPTLFALAYSWVFLLLGVVLIGLWVARSFTLFEGPGSPPLALIGVLFVVAGLVIYYTHNEQIFIEKDTGVYFKKTWLIFSSKTELSKSYRHVPVENLDTIQYLSHEVKHRTNRARRRSTYTEYQVNLCCKAGERYNLFFTLNSSKADKCALEISALLGLPLQRI